MAAIDLSGATNVPYLHSVAGVGTTYQEFKLPSWCCRVTMPHRSSSPRKAGHAQFA